MSQRLPVASVYTLDTGGCGSCQQSIAALSAVRHLKALAAGGVQLTESPLAANVVLVTGTLSAAADPAARQVLENISEPKVIVAIGDCATGGCVFSGSPHVAANAAEALDVHIEVGGCPVTPTEILDAIQKARELLVGGESVSAGVNNA